MNKLELLLKRWQNNQIKDPDLNLALSYIHGIQLEKVKNERKDEPADIKGTSRVPERTYKGNLPRSTEKGL